MRKVEQAYYHTEQAIDHALATIVPARSAINQFVFVTVMTQETPLVDGDFSLADQPRAFGRRGHRLTTMQR